MRATSWGFKSPLRHLQCQPLTQIVARGVPLIAIANPSCFLQKGPDTCTKEWKFKDREPDVPGAIGWQAEKFKQKRGFGGSCENKVAFNLRSKSSATMVTPTGTRFRQSIRIGDDCATAVLACEATGLNQKLKCSSVSP